MFCCLGIRALCWPVQSRPSSWLYSGVIAGPLPPRVLCEVKMPVTGLGLETMGRQEGRIEGGAAGRATRLLSPTTHPRVSRESPGHLDRWDLRVLEVSRGHQAPRAKPSRDLW